MTIPKEGATRKGFWAFLDERLGLSGLSYPVPKYSNSLAYVLGGISLFGFLILIVTGIFLVQFYHPHPADAHESVIYIVETAPFGDFIRSVHFWTANLVIVTAILHLIRVFANASFKRPREINWLFGLMLLALSFGLFFTGTVLKWDQEGVEALGHNREIGELLGFVGTWFTGEFTRSVPLLTRLYVSHISILPIFLLGLIAVHLYLIKQLGISPEASEDAISGSAVNEQSVSRFSVHLRRLLGYGLLFLTLVGTLALLLPAPLGQAGIPGAEVTKPPWIFLPFYLFENWFGIKGLLISSSGLFILLALVPVLDRSPWLSPRKRRWIILLATVLLLILILFGIAAWLTTPEVAHLMENRS
jgi:quinol-cytochrome oxidoreductase complex cytochrome b subunit